MRASWKASPLRSPLIFNRLTKPWGLISALFAMGLAMPTVMAQAPAPSAQQPASTAPAPAAEEQPHAARPGGPHESIKVHGHWVIEVKNPDGSLAQRREFENSLQGIGKGPLAGVLLGSNVAAGWQVALIGDAVGSNTKTAPCGAACVLEQQQLLTIAPCPAGCSSNLAASFVRSGAGAAPSGFTLSGWIQATQAGNIGVVVTNIVFCGGEVVALYGTTPAQCAAGQNATHSAKVIFTEAFLPVASSASHPCGASGENSCEITGILANQMINVSVTITFQ